MVVPIANIERLPAACEEVVDCAPVEDGFVDEKLVELVIEAPRDTTELPLRG